MPDQNKPTPVETLRDGRLKATIWENHGKDGNYYSTSLAKTYEDRQGRLQDSHSFTGSELLRIAELARESSAFIRDLRRMRTQDRAPEQDQKLERFRNAGQRR